MGIAAYNRGSRMPAWIAGGKYSLERLDSMIGAVSGKRLTYARLTA